MIPIIILAAGASLRMGKPKQLLSLQGETLLERAINTALTAAAGPIIVILGANHEAIGKAIASRPVTPVICADWPNGLSASIKSGIAYIQAFLPAAGSALLMLCDQPFVDAALLQKMIAAQKQSAKKMIAAAYADTLGVPVLVDRSLFPELLKLSGRQGAKILLDAYPGDVATVPFPKGNMDIDTPEDYERICKELNNPKVP